jgi:hypothetical protein
MSKRSVLTACVIATLATSSAMGQLRGAVSGTISGLQNTVGGVTGIVGGVVGGVGSTVGQTVGSVGGTVGSLTGPIGGTVGSLTSPLTNSLDQSSNSVTGIAGRIGRAPQDSYSLLNQLAGPEYADYSAGQLADLRRTRLEALIRANPQALERDDQGQPVRKGQLMATNPDHASLAAAERAGFRIIASEVIGDVGIRIVIFATPRGMNIRKGMKALRQAAPHLQIDYNHVYEPAGGALLPAAASALAASRPIKRGTRIVMIDGGVASHPSLESAGIEQRGFVGTPEPTGHGTAVGSLLVGNHGSFRGAARGAQLFVADVYGGNPAAGSATAIIRALAWGASKRPSVINISLVGPPNQAMERAIAAVRARGISVVAAVGNDGPAAPPQYPASYPGVIAVTGVDAADRALREAGRSAHLDFAAPGADLVAALPGDGYSAVRGTSFAAPFVAARLAATGSPALLASEALPGKGKVGRGIVCRTCRVAPKMVGIR